jgi:predicted metal-binding membrane protein
VNGRFSRLLTFAVLVAIGGIAWAFLVRSEEAMTTMAGDGPIVRLMWLMMRPAEFLPYFFAAALMWVIMMIAMMVPAVVPMVMVMRGVDRGPHRERDTLLFAAGYLVGWSAFGLLAAFLQLWLHARGVLGGDRLAVGALGAGLLLLAAGVYQLTPWKAACLRHCRSPASFFLEHWSPGGRGALAMGLRHGLYCVGCCWVLMLLMFVGGTMSVLTMAALCAFILAERLLPDGPWVSRIPGTAMIVSGALLIASR